MHGQSWHLWSYPRCSQVILWNDCFTSYAKLFFLIGPASISSLSSCGSGPRASNVRPTAASFSWSPSRARPASSAAKKSPLLKGKAALGSKTCKNWDFKSRLNQKSCFNVEMFLISLFHPVLFDYKIFKQLRSFFIKNKSVKTWRLHSSPNEKRFYCLRGSLQPIVATFES